MQKVEILYSKWRCPPEHGIIFTALSRKHLKMDIKATWFIQNVILIPFIFQCSWVKSYFVFNLACLFYIRACSLALKQNEKDTKICLTVSILEKSKKSSLRLDILRNMVMPFLLGTVIKGQFTSTVVLPTHCHIYQHHMESLNNEAFAIHVNSTLLVQNYGRASKERMNICISIVELMNILMWKTQMCNCEIIIFVC